MNIRQKGQNGEREAAFILGKMIEREDLTRNLEQVRSGGADITDIPGLTIEVKRQETLNVKMWWRQVCIAADNRGDIPVLMWRQNRKGWSFALPAYLLTMKAKGMIIVEQSDFRVWLRHYLELE